MKHNGAGADLIASVAGFGSGWDNNVLRLDTEALERWAADFATTQPSLDELIKLYDNGLRAKNPLMTHIVAPMSDNIEPGKDSIEARSFRRGRTVAYEMIDASSAGGAPILGMFSYDQAFGYLVPERGASDTTMNACVGILATQIDLHRAFETATRGLPSDTKTLYAQFGAGAIFTLCAVAHMHGGTGVEFGWVQPK